MAVLQSLLSTVYNILNLITRYDILFSTQLTFPNCTYWVLKGKIGGLCAEQHQGRMSWKIIMAIDGKTTNWHFTHTFLSNGFIPPTWWNAEEEKSMCWVTHHKVVCTCRAYVQMKNCSCMDEGGRAKQTRYWSWIIFQDIIMSLTYCRNAVYAHCC